MSIAVETAILVIFFATGNAYVPLVYGLIFIGAVGGAFH